MSNVSVGGALATNVILSECDADDHSVNRLLLSLRLRQFKFFHTFSNAPRALARHTNIAEVARMASIR
jgi:hypothetical protein